MKNDWRDFEEYVFAFSEENRLIKECVREFAEDKLLPISVSVENETHFPAGKDSPLRQAFWRTINIMREYGYIAFGLPEIYGGIPASSKEQAIFLQELCRVDGALGLSIAATVSLVAHPIALFGSTEQKKEWLPRIAQGEIVGCYAQTEPDAGSDVKNIKTKAYLDKNGIWRIEGSKVFITNGSEANLAIVIARTSGEPHKGLSAFLVDMNSQLACAPLNEKKGGLHSSPTSRLTFYGAPAELLGGIDNGWHIAMATLISSRATSISSQGIGIADGALNALLPYVKMREVFGKKIRDFPINAETLARMKTMLEMAKLLCFRACFLKDCLGAENYRLWQAEASMAKRFGAYVAEQIPALAIQLAGGVGYTKELRLVKFWQDGKAVPIYEGTDQIQEIIISKALSARTDKEKITYKRSAKHTMQNDLAKLKRLFNGYCSAAATKYCLPSKEEIQRNSMPIIRHKLAFALCVLEGAELLLWKQAYLQKTGCPENVDEAIVALHLAEEALISVRAALRHPEYEKAALKVAERL